MSGTLIGTGNLILNKINEVATIVMLMVLSFNVQRNNFLYRKRSRKLYFIQTTGCSGASGPASRVRNNTINGMFGVNFFV